MLKEHVKRNADDYNPYTEPATAKRAFQNTTLVTMFSI